MKSRNSKYSDIQNYLTNTLQEVSNLLTSKEAESIPELTRMRKKIEYALNNARDSAANALSQSKEMTISADKYAHHEPWKLIGAALAAGALIDFFFCHRAD